jgi:SSS family solute:Na+ symporter
MMAMAAICLAAGPAPAAEAAGSAAAPPLRGLTPADWAIVVLYAAAMLGVGLYYSRRQKTTEEYLLGGRRMRSFLVGISLYASLLSTITYLAVPGEMIKHGPVPLLGYLAIPVIFLVVGYSLIPHFMRLPYTSAYEILESRLGPGVRLTAAAIFVVTRLVWMALLIYLAGKAMTTMMGWPHEAVLYIIIVSGVITVVYTTLGGLRGVVVTDTIQFFILMLGPLLAIVSVSWTLGGVGAWFPTTWAAHWDSEPFFSLDPHVRVTVVGSLVSYAAWWICTAGSDQMAIQRYFATRDAPRARRAFLINSIAEVSVAVLLSLTGFALLAFFSGHGQFGQGHDAISDADYLFPHYIANYAPAGIAGLIVAGMFSAAMSSLSSGVNSTVAVLTTDFVYRFTRTFDDARRVRTTKLLVLSIGLIVVLVSLLMDKVPGNIFEVTNKTNGLFVGPLFGLFVMALFVRGATAFGTLWGAIHGLAAAGLIAYWDVITGRPGLSFQWIIPSALLAQIASGCLWSLAPTSGANRSRLLAWNLAAAGVLVALVAGIVAAGR